MASKHEPLSNVDAAWLSMDDPTNLMMITGVMTFSAPLSYNHFLAVVEHRWLKFERFRQRLVKSRLPVGKPYWELDPHFDVSAHIHRVALPEPGDQAALQRMVSDLASTPLDPSKPLWQVTLIENYGEGSALVARIHHSIADGLALVFVLLSLTDMTPDAPWPEPRPQEEESEDRGGLVSNALGSLFKTGATAANAASRVTGRIARESWDIANDPSQALVRMQQGVDVSYATSRLLLLTPDPETPFKGDLGVSKRAAWTLPIPLRDVKAIKNATRTTVNDVMVSTVSGALRRYLQSKGAPTDDFRAVVPVNMRRNEEMGKLGNKFGVVFLSLPVGIEDPLDRLAEVHRRMSALKGSSEAVVALGILNAMGLSPAEIQSLILQVFASKSTTVLTNVPGPPMPLFLAGREIEDMMFWVPQAGRLGMGISILSYAGKVYVGVITDAGLIPDPDSIIDFFYEEFDLLKEELLDIKVPQFTGETPRRAALADDLTRIHGIDAETAEFLNQNGLHTFAQLASFPGVQLQALLEQEGDRFNGVNAANWPTQARYLSSL